MIHRIGARRVRTANIANHDIAGRPGDLVTLQAASDHFVVAEQGGGAGVRADIAVRPPPGEVSRSLTVVARTSTHPERTALTLLTAGGAAGSTVHSRAASVAGRDPHAALLPRRRSP